MTDLFDLKGKAAIVTGGNGGIGFGIARGLAMPAPTSPSSVATRPNRKRRLDASIPVDGGYSIIA